ncbi:hypothetical protein ACFX1T_025651 [Malus domestica]
MLAYMLLQVFCASVIPYRYKFKEDASAFDGLIQLGDDKEKKVTFVTYPETQAKSIVTNTSGLNHDAILRVWMVLEATHYIHSHGSYHGDLSCIGSFVIVGKKVKLVNIEKEFHSMHGLRALSHKLSKPKGVSRFVK